MSFLPPILSSTLTIDLFFFFTLTSAYCQRHTYTVSTQTGSDDVIAYRLTRGL